MSESTPKLPQSVTSFRINLLGLVCFLAGLWVLNQQDLFASIADSKLRQTTLQALWLIGCWSVPIVLLEAFYFRRLERFEASQLSVFRALKKTVGLYATLAVCGALYWIFPEYHGSFYNPYWDLLKLLAPWVLIGSFPYFYLTDGYFKEPQDSYELVGNTLFGKASPEGYAFLKQHALGWLVKWFFLPLMTVYFSKTTQFFASVDTSAIFTSFIKFYDFAWELIFAVDLGIVTAGYILALRLLDSHIRSSEPTVAGWLAAIVCYQPFWSAISVGYLAYNKDNFQWGAWLAGNELGTILWGSAILILISIYSLASVAFGIRFSNLTHRGIITTGPYRYTKHPAYLSKNLSWWFISIPFVTNSGDFTLIIQSCLMLLGVNMIYYFRAVTEERHLGMDPVYQQYQRAMAHRGLLGRLENITGRTQATP